MLISEILKAQTVAEEQNRSYAVLTLAATSGTTSRTQGKMLVFEDGQTVGTIGGGPGEHAAVQQAIPLIGKDETRLVELEHGFGRMTVLLETFAAPPLIVLCGGGNVSRCLMQYAKLAGFRLWLLDPRPCEAIAEAVRLADRYFPVEDYESALDAMEIPENAFYVSASFSHATDENALRGILKKKSAYVGMLGSQKKITQLFGNLRRQGYTEEQLSRIHTPIGLDVGGQTPEELAVGILAEILMVKNGKIK